MVDFKKKLGGKGAERPTDPIKIYEALDREADKGPLRPAQSAVLEDWREEHLSERDIIIKLHTGQGKTLIGLLMLQARLNGGHGPVVYVCPNNYLVEQTIEQARQFGFKTCASDGELPDEFLDSRSIFITSVQKLFNGRTKFGIGKNSVPVDTILMDDAHACADTIRDQCQINIPRKEPAYSAIKSMFSAELEQQGVGTYADIENEKRDALLQVPYWSWISHESEVASLLSDNAERKSIKFAWPILKDILKYCQCNISGTSIQIEPYIAPLEEFGSYHKANHRIFMSATVTNDAFLVKGLQLKPEIIANPLTFEKEKWSGEKMVLLPSLIHEDLDREHVLGKFAKASGKRNFGYVVLSPSFAKAEQWKANGAIIASGEDISKIIQGLKSGQFENTVTLANRYDGIDLPDKACRVLIFDSKPYSENLADLYQEYCRPNSAATLMRTVRTVEQGMGRSVRGEKDYSLIIVLGTDLVRLLRDRRTRQYLSSQMSTQIEIGLEIGEMARHEINEGVEPWKGFIDLGQKCVGRDEDWKAFYIEKMEDVRITPVNTDVLNIYRSEYEAELAFKGGDYQKANDIVQKLMDEISFDDDDKGWYLQDMARFNYIDNRVESESLQKAAHKKNRLLLKPGSGVTVKRLTLVSQGRAERVRSWITNHQNFDDLNVHVSDILGRLVSGTKAERFESALNELSQALGFVGERPDAEWKEGPDNLWALDDRQYIFFECKSEVIATRGEVNKSEAEQMNRSSAWFGKYYPGMLVKRVLIHPAGKLESAAAFTHDVEVMRDADLRKFVRSAKDFFKAFEMQNLNDLSNWNIQKNIDAYNLSVEDIISKYSRGLKVTKR